MLCFGLQMEALQVEDWALGLVVGSTGPPLTFSTSRVHQPKTAWDHEAYEGPAILLHEAILGKHSVGVEETRQQARKRRFASARVPSDDDIPGSQLWQS